MHFSMQFAIVGMLINQGVLVQLKGKYTTSRLHYSLWLVTVVVQSTGAAIGVPKVNSASDSKNKTAA